ncbi:MAG: LPS assembly lipoprotein LptE [bacterium]
MRIDPKLFFYSFLFAFSCGYSTSSLLPSHLRTIAIGKIENSSTQPGLAEELIFSLPKAFNINRSLRVTNIDQADLVITALITNYSRIAAAYNSNQEISAYEINITVQIDVLDQVRNEPFYSGSITSRISYNPETNREEEMVKTLVEKLAQEIVRQVITAW